mgnify:CR=1 FL=1
MTEIYPKNESDNGLLKPHMIKQKLDEYVIGQTEAKLDAEADYDVRSAEAPQKTDQNDEKSGN